MILSAVMDELATKLDTIAGLRVFAFPADNVSAPAAIVGYPETLTFDTSMSRGVDSLTFPVFLLVGRLTDRNSRDALGAYVDGAGAQSVKQALQTKPHTAMSTVRVASVEFSVITIAAVDYLVAVFSVDCTGPGD